MALVFGRMPSLNLVLPYGDSRQQFLRMVFNVFVRNVDGHTKIFSFCMTPDGVGRLSPAYDLTYAVDLSAPTYINRHSITINDKNEGIKSEDFEVDARRNDIQNYKSLIEMVRIAVGRFREFAASMKIDKQLIESIEKDFVRE